MYISDPMYPAVVRMKKIQFAKEYATEYYNVDRDTFIGMICVRYENDEYLFNAALNEYDVIQEELNNYFENVA